MKLLNVITMLAVATAVPVAGAQAAAVRPGITAFPTATKAGKLPGRVRAGASTEQGSSLLGAPLFLAFLGAVVITIGTIIIINNNNGSSSPQSS